MLQLGKSITWSSLNVTEPECHWMSLNIPEAKWNNSFWEIKILLKFRVLKLFKIRKNCENVGEKLFKMVINVEKLLKMVKNGDFSKFVKKWWNVGKCWWKH